VVAAIMFRIGNATHSTPRGSDASEHYATATGQRATITLTDGTRVTLAPQSVLRVVPPLNGATRTVALVGEAYFEVHGKSDAPFVVRTGAVATRVLGTTFSVRYYITDPRVQVAVTTGKVVVSALTRQHPTITLTAGAVGAVTDSMAVLISVDSAAQYTAWTAGQLHFYRVPITDVLATLTRWYGYQFRLADPALSDHRLTAVLDTWSAASALGTIKLLLNVDLTFDANVVTLHPRRAGHAPAPDGRGSKNELTFPQTGVGR